MKDRILELMSYENLAPGRFALAIGVSQSAMSHYTNGKRKPSMDVVNRILKAFPHINADWLMSGKGRMLRGENDDQANISDDTMPDLFAETRPVAHDSSKTSEYRRETEPPQVQKRPQQPVKEVITVRETIDRRITKIMVFYSNQTFDTFVPEK